MTRLLAVIALLLAGAPLSQAQARGEAFVLSDRCPPGFEKTTAGACELRNLYQLYDSLQDRGVGGTRTSLPAARDGRTRPHGLPS